MAMVPALNPGLAPPYVRNLFGPPALAQGPASDTVILDGEAVRRRQEELSILASPGQVNPGWVTLPGGLRVEAHKPNATLAVIDTFGTQVNPQTGRVDPAHGEITAALAQQTSGTGESNLLRIDASATPIAPLDGENFDQNLDQMITRNYIRSAQNTTDALREIRQNHPSITTVTESMGMNGPYSVEHLQQQAGANPEFAQALRQELGLPEGTDFQNPQAMVALARRVQSTLQNSPEVTLSQSNLNLELSRSQGHFTYFNSAGNSGQTQDILAANGFTFEDRFAGNAPGQNPATRTVAATSPLPTGFGQSMAVPARYSQRVVSDDVASGQVRPQMDGVEACFNVIPSLIPRIQACQPYTGTSFAAPRAAGLFHADSLAVQRLSQQAL